jgi:pimeloyl-ACP methyl ester carboxylesterase
MLGALLLQVLLGVGLAYLLAHFQHWPAWSLALVVLAALVGPLSMGNLYSCVVSRDHTQTSAAWWRALPNEILAGLRVFVLRLPWAMAASVELRARAPEAKVPVLLVHGYMCNYSIWDKMAKELARAGHSVLAINLEPAFAPIDHHAHAIEAGVDRLCHDSNNHQVALVGHSMGGLAIRAWARHYGHARARCIVTLATPHWGTQLANKGNTECTRQMLWHSPWLRELAAQESEPLREKIRIGISRQDNMVFPQQAQVLEHASVMFFSGLGHVSTCLDSTVIDWVRHQLDAPTAG